jgi:hypothetical protein
LVDRFFVVTRRITALCRILPWGNVSFGILAQSPPADLDIPIVGQLPPTDLPFGDALEPGSL